MTSPRFDKQELTHALEHLAFEIRWFRIFEQRAKDGSLHLRDSSCGQAVGYCVLIHFQILLAFFYDTQPRKDDVVVTDFRAMRGFSKAFPTVRDLSQEERNGVLEELNKRLAHQTARRWREKAPNMDFYRQYFVHLNHLIDDFVRALPMARRVPFEESIRTALN
jgi:hypothetical protein